VVGDIAAPAGLVNPDAQFGQPLRCGQHVVSALARLYAERRTWGAGAEQDVVDLSAARWATRSSGARGLGIADEAEAADDERVA
jgi:hypothetical protein